MSDLLTTAAALESITASRWTLLMAQLFGEKKTRTDERGTVTVAKWRGKYYMLDYKPACPHGHVDWSDCPDCGH